MQSINGQSGKRVNQHRKLREDGGGGMPTPKCPAGAEERERQSSPGTSPSGQP